MAAFTEKGSGSHRTPHLLYALENCLVLDEFGVKMDFSVVINFVFLGSPFLLY